MKFNKNMRKNKNSKTRLTRSGPKCVFVISLLENTVCRAVNLFVSSRNRKHRHYGHGNVKHILKCLSSGATNTHTHTCFHCLARVSRQ